MITRLRAALELGNESVISSGRAPAAAAGRTAPWQFWSRLAHRLRGPAQKELASSLNLHSDYEGLVRNVCARYGLLEDSLRIRAATMGFTGEREVYAVLVAPRVTDPSTCAYLTFLAPRIFRRAKAAAEAHWLYDYSSFAGVWTQWPIEVPVPHEVNPVLRARWNDISSIRDDDALGHA